jgi:hypothetical protein
MNSDYVVGYVEFAKELTTFQHKKMSIDGNKRTQNPTNYYMESSV